jgi:transposase
MGQRGQHYEEEFQRDAVDHLIRTGKSMRQTALDLGVSEQSLSNWKKKYLAEQDGPQRKTLEERISQLEKENLELREERDILKKSVAIFLKPRK